MDEIVVSYNNGSPTDMANFIDVLLFQSFWSMPIEEAIGLEVISDFGPGVNTPEVKLQRLNL